MPPQLIDLTGDALQKATSEWKKLESACIVDILSEMENDFFPKLEDYSFEDGITISSFYELGFKPNKHLVEYYQPIEGRKFVTTSVIDVHQYRRLRAADVDHVCCSLRANGGHPL